MLLASLQARIIDINTYCHPEPAYSICSCVQSKLKSGSGPTTCSAHHSGNTRISRHWTSPANYQGIPQAQAGHSQPFSTPLDGLPRESCTDTDDEVYVVDAAARPTLSKHDTIHLVPADHHSQHHSDPWHGPSRTEACSVR
jgi:hypothetical protein